MSSRASVYIGPYAVWVGALGLLAEEEAPSFEELGAYFGESLTAELEYGRGDVKAVIYVPMRGGPKRTVRYDYPPGGCAALDLRGIDQEAELEAFRKAYAAELAELTAAAGRGPEYRWGLVYCYS